MVSELKRMPYMKKMIEFVLNGEFEDLPRVEEALVDYDRRIYAVGGIYVHGADFGPNGHGACYYAEIARFTNRDGVVCAVVLPHENGFRATVVRAIGEPTPIGYRSPKFTSPEFVYHNCTSGNCDYPLRECTEEIALL